MNSERKKIISFYWDSMIDGLRLLEEKEGGGFCWDDYCNHQIENDSYDGKFKTDILKVLLLWLVNILFIIFILSQDLNNDPISFLIFQSIAFLIYSVAFLADEFLRLRRIFKRSPVPDSEDIVTFFTKHRDSAISHFEAAQKKEEAELKRAKMIDLLTEKSTSKN